MLIQELEDFTPPALRDAARAAGHDRVTLHGALVELPRYLAAKRLIARARDLGVG